jgi:hypothetical protein
LEWIVTAVYWWFPPVYVAKQQLERHEEACCDAWAVRRLGTSPREYAETLLRVVDFISEHNTRIPRFASGMQPTESLEERLRLLMRRHSPDDGPSSLRLSVGAACIALWLVHPIPLPSHRLDVKVDPATSETEPPRSLVDTASMPVVGDAGEEPDLPDPPKGFWNQRPGRTWANFSLKLPGARLIAESSRGISIEIPGRDPLGFSASEMSAIAEIPSTQRVVIGDHAGQVRLWDLSAGMPVSLIGKHTAAVTSLAYHPTGGLVSADEGGSVIRWDLQSGQVLATWSTARLSPESVAESVQSTRFADDGSLLAILTGNWSKIRGSQQVHFVESRSLQTISTSNVEPGTAVVLQLPEFGWIAVDWSGKVRSIDSQATIATVDKHRVSALVLSHTPRRLGPTPSVN